MALRALLLDFCGTLAVERTSRAALYSAAAARAGLAVSEERMAALMARAHAALPRELDGAYRYSDAWFERFIADVFHGGLGLPREALPGIAAELFARFSDPATFRLLPGVEELCAAARARGLALGVVSNWSGRLAALLEGLGLARHFDAVLASAVERLEKPDPALFRRALGRLSVAPEEALHLGDTPDKDVAGARAAGIRAVLVDRSGTMSAERVGAPVVRALSEALALLTDGTPRPNER